MSEVLLTQAGVEKLKKEKEDLINVQRPKVIEELQLARSQVTTNRFKTSSSLTYISF